MTSSSSSHKQIQPNHNLIKQTSKYQTLFDYSLSTPRYLNRTSRCLLKTSKKRYQKSVQYADLIQWDNNDTVKRPHDDHQFNINAKRRKFIGEFISMNSSFTILPVNAIIVVPITVS